MPLAIVAANAASETLCPSAGICGIVFNDTNGNGVQDAGDQPVSGATVTVVGASCPDPINPGPGDICPVATNSFGFYYFPVPPGTYEISVQIPNDTQPSPSNVGDDAFDSDGVSDGKGNSVATVTLTPENSTSSTTDFGFSTSGFTNPGTGTPGYWKNHPEAWPIQQITIGERTYTKAEAIALLEKPGKDKTLTMFSSLVPAILNTLIGNDSGCVSSTITMAQEWMKKYGPVGSNVAASSYAWKVGEPLHRTMDNYNNGMLCAPHRD
ncbi:MAG: SdrD B-like domain-containing protein [Acidobacteriota bacterium]